MEKIVIFDWGGVIESHEKDDYNVKKVILDIVRHYNCTLTETEIMNICSNSTKLMSTFIKGDNQTISKWFETICKDLKIDCLLEDYKNLYNVYGKKINYYKEVVELAHSLKGKCKIAIFSNLVKLDEKRINEQVDLSKFDYAFLSYETGYVKPEEKAYEIVEKTTKEKPENILLIDDTLENIETAKSRGWCTCKAFGYEFDKIKEAVENFLGFKIN